MQNIINTLISSGVSLNNFKYVFNLYQNLTKFNSYYCIS